MANKTRSTTRIRKRGFVCPDCGFKAAHAMGLGRHRSAIHGVPSKRELAGRRRGRGSGSAEISRLQRRVATLERRVDSLLKGLRRASR